MVGINLSARMANLFSFPIAWQVALIESIQDGLVATDSILVINQTRWKTLIWKLQCNLVCSSLSEK
ncbi:hypothetical protein L228DRAFT_6999 [Xylona heveae TC161]|uniref:Uncharacterized protein n=1 Tax=Xylona heveae (strain CBS 132557 / TC161) TaxID=1328760 RepID=A0A165JFQ1_XYLHT|nr:hypothetical protein L228DRAFT_6999 [Xylona heveae TC161]KZF26175.1 hypothetical protein L228DRAFT_6999 [Xylona heveae TC161]